MNCALTRRLIGCVGAASIAVGAAAQQSVHVPSLDAAADGAALMLPARWHAVPAVVPAPAWVLLHGCGGPYAAATSIEAASAGATPTAAPERSLSIRMSEYAALLNAQGHHALVLDSLTPRGERELCTQRVGARRLTQVQRRRDALGALQWLAQQPGVDATRLGLIGWSHGGSTVLAAINLTHPEVARASVRPRAAVAFYPGCRDERRRGFEPAAPLLMLLGAADDWTPAAPCEALAREAATPRPEAEKYPGAFHGFDGRAPVRLRRDVPNGERPGQGVHVGGDDAARARSRERLVRFVAERMSAPQ